MDRDEEALLAGESVARDYFYAGGLQFPAKCFEIGDAERGMAARFPVDRRRVLLSGQMKLLHAALIPCARVAAICVGWTLERLEAE